MAIEQQRVSTGQFAKAISQSAKQFPGVRFWDRWVLLGGQPEITYILKFTSKEYRLIRLQY